MAKARGLGASLDPRSVVNLKKTLWPNAKKGIGAPLFVEEDGPVLGVLDDIFLDSKSGSPQAYKVVASGVSFELPAESVYETPAGFVYRSPWYTEAEAVVRKLESQELLMPELLFSSTSTSESDRKIVEAAVDNSPALKKEIDQAREIHRSLIPRLDALSKEKFKLVQEMAELTEGLATGRESGEAYRSRFVALKRRLQVIEATLRRGESLRTRLERMPWIPPSAGSNGHGNGDGGNSGAPGSPSQRPPSGNPEDWKRIKKIRVLKTEKDLVEREQRLRKLEEQGGVGGVSLDQAVGIMSGNFSSLSQVYSTGGEPAVRTELHRLLTAARASAPKPSAGSAKPEISAPSHTGKACPLCAQPLQGNEATCPSCGADLRNAAPAPKGEKGAGGGKFVKGGGATKLGLVLLITAGAIAVLSFVLR